jgi:hypothetical protein
MYLLRTWWEEKRKNIYSDDFYLLEFSVQYQLTYIHYTQLVSLVQLNEWLTPKQTQPYTE